jgi:hypothetical protein
VFVTADFLGYPLDQASLAEFVDFDFLPVKELRYAIQTWYPGTIFRGKRILFNAVMQRLKSRARAASTEATFWRKEIISN